MTVASVKAYDDFGGIGDALATIAMSRSLERLTDTQLEQHAMRVARYIAMDTPVRYIHRLDRRAHIAEKRRRGLKQKDNA